MKQFFLYVLATIVGIMITCILSVVGSILMFIVMIAMAAAGPQAPAVQKHSILHICLDGPIVERQQGQTFIEQVQGIENKQIPLNDLVASIRHAATDPKIEGIFIDAQGAGGGVASIAYVVEELNRFKESGKWVAAYADTYTQAEYYMASVADSLWLNPVGMIDIHGLGGTTLYFKGLLDKLNVEMQIFKVGTYKSAVEPYILTGPSEANREQLMATLTPIWDCIKTDIASARSVEPSTVNAWADSIIMCADPATFAARNLVTSLRYRHEIEDELKELSGIDSDDDLRLIGPMSYAASIKQQKSDNTIAVVYADGDITESGSEGITSDKMVPLILDLADDDDIDAMVLRVNSPGGSAFASEQIWEALEQFKAKGKPLYVSMGDMAASGGYYISCGADKIFAQPVTITGSIGIFGMVPSVKGFLNDKLGVTLATISTNPEANLSILEPFTPAQKAAFQNMIDRGYETFTSRCAAGRNMPVDSIKAIAEGRIWDGTTALRIGLVDELGTLSDCLDALAESAGYEDYSVAEYPEPKGEWWEELLLESQGLKATMLQRELGPAYPYFQSMRKALDADPVQCRAPEIIVK